MTPDQDDFRRRAVRAALTVAGIAVVIGLVIGGLTAAGVYLTGVVPESAPEPVPTRTGPDKGTLPTPSLKPTPSPSEPSPAATQTSSAEPSESPTPTRTKSRKPERERPIVLNAGVDSAESYEEVTLSGRYPGGDGTTLEVQRREGGSWASFPTSATVDGGSFSTFVQSGQPGRNAFRVVDPSSGETSNVVVFTVS